jgi:hypothetical protein
MTSPRLKTGQFALVIFLLVAVIALLMTSGLPPFGPRASRSSGKIGSSFIGITNNSTVGLSALIALTNQNNWDIGFVLYPAQVRSGWVWPAVGSAPLVVSMLPRGGIPALLSVPIPTNGSPWRVPLCWVRLPSKYDFGVNLWALSSPLWRGAATPTNFPVLPEKYQYPTQTNFVAEVQN